MDGNPASLYQHYASLGQDISSLPFIKKWKCLAEQGLWRLLVNQPSQWDQLNWQDCFTAIEGLVSVCDDPPFVSLLVSYLNILYLLSKHGSKQQQFTYLPRLMKGAGASIVIAEFSNNLKRCYLFNDYPVPSFLEKTDIVILITHTALALGKRDIVFFVLDQVEGKAPLPLANQVLGDERSLTKDHLLVPPAQGRDVFYDLLRVKKLFYSILGINAALEATRVYFSTNHLTSSLENAMRISKKKLITVLRDENQI